MAVEATPPPVASAGVVVDDALIERIVTAVVERLSDQVVRDIAWDVVPELAQLHIERKLREQG